MTSFEGYGEELEKTPLEDRGERPSAQRTLLVEVVEEAKLGCVLGMVLCLARERVSLHEVAWRVSSTP